MADIIKARSIPVTQHTGNMRCDFCHNIIPIGKTASQVIEGKAQGVYHGRMCYEGAVAHYEKLQTEEGISDEDIEF